MLKEILSIQTTTYEQWRIFRWLVTRLSVLEDTEFYVHKGNIYVTKGCADAYPCVVAHMDSVHDIVEDLTAIEIDGKITGFNKVTMEQVGIGGDDKVGIYIAMRCLLDFDNIKVAFFRDEEVGCRGSGDADMGFFKDCKYVLQCDRKGNSDFIINGAGTDLSSAIFQEHVSMLLPAYGYNFEYGSITDVVALKENGLGVSCANISCGYYNPHMDTEYVVVADVERCLELVQGIIGLLDGVYEHEYVPTTYTKYAYTPAKIKWDDDYCGMCWADRIYHDELCYSCFQDVYGVSEDTKKKTKWYN